MTKGIVILTIIAVMALAITGCGPRAAQPPTATPVDGIVLPYPEDGNQYRISEICKYLEAESHDIRGTIHHTVDADDLSGVLDKVPSLARKPVENYIGDGVLVTFEINGLCRTFNR